MVCKNCGYNNLEGVDFCRHCGVSFKERPSRAVKVVKPSAKRTPASYFEPYAGSPDRSARNVNVVISPAAGGDEEEERVPRSGSTIKTATIAIGLCIIACVIAFCIFAFDLLELAGSGESITVDSLIFPADTATPVPTPTLTPVPTVAPVSGGN